MRRRLAVACAALLALGAAGPSPKAALSVDRGSQAEENTLELVVLEVPGCVYCAVLRRDVLPGYRASTRQAAAPLRFVDLNDPAADRLGLDGPATIVPTTVLLKGNREVGRIAGAFGPTEFLRLIDDLLASVR